jgi:hypothetical protein
MHKHVAFAHEHLAACCAADVSVLLVLHGIASEQAFMHGLNLCVHCILFCLMSSTVTYVHEFQSTSHFSVSYTWSAILLVPQCNAVRRTDLSRCMHVDDGFEYLKRPRMLM